MSRAIVIDASVAIKWTIDEELSEAAQRLISFTSRLRAPDILLAEAANVCRKKVRRGEIDIVQGRFALAAIAQIIPEFGSVVVFVDDAFALAVNLDHHSYDCFYLAQAAAIGGMVVTADRALQRKVSAARIDVEVLVLDEPMLIDRLLASA